MKTLTAFVAAIVVQFIALSSASAGIAGPYVVELAGTYSKVIVTGSAATGVKTVVKPLNKAALCGLLNVEPSKHVLVVFSNKVMLLNKQTGATVANFMTLGNSFIFGSVKGSFAYEARFFDDIESVGSFSGKYRLSPAAKYLILTGNFQGGTSNPPVVVGGGAENSALFFKGKVIYVKNYTGPLL